jgi:hypothetical protein
MPWYQFALDGQSVPEEQEPEWHSGDVAAIISAAKVTVDLIRNRHDGTPIPIVLTSRVER